MIKSQDLDAAVAAGIIARTQADALLAFAATQRTCSAFTAGADERFRFLHGFNDVFLAIGVAFISAAMLPILSDGHPLLMFVPPFVLWGLSEILARRLRSVLPSIVAAASFVAYTGYLASGVMVAPQDLDGVVGGAGNSERILELRMFFGCAAGLLAALLYYVRFRLPFAWLLMAAALAGTLVAGTSSLAGGAATPLRDLMWLAVGLLAFGLAMRFDINDPNRLTRRSDCGFWLHLAAAPLIVHPLVGPMLWSSDGIDAHNPFAVLAVVAVLGLVAIIVDRRALLVSSLLYLSIALAYLLKATNVSESHQIGLVLALVGAFVLSLGLGWRQARAIIVRPIAGWPLINRLPPIPS